MSFLGEIKRRKVFQVAAVYAVTAWILVQIIVAIEQPLQLPEWADTFVIILLTVGFPVALILTWAFDLTPEGIQSTRAGSHASVSPVQSTKFTYVSQGLLLLAVGFLVFDQYWGLGSTARNLPAPTNVLRYRYGLAEEERLVPTQSLSIDVSADGARIVYVGPSENGTQLWIRERDQLRGTVVPGSEDAVQPFFAPDGRRVGFVTQNGELKVVSRIGDPPLRLVDTGLNRFGASWAEDGNIYFSTAAGLMRTADTGGGDEELVVSTESAGPEVQGYAWPDVLPNARGAVFTIVRNHVASDVAVVDFSTGNVHLIAQGLLGRFVESGHLIYVKEDGGLMAVTYDPDEMRVIGEAVLLPDELPAGTPPPDLAVSKTGRLIYATRPRLTLEVVWVDREGNWVPVDPATPMQGIRYVSLSPDNTMLAVTTWLRPPGDDGEIWIKQLPRGPYARFTFEGTVNMRPSWTPDGRSLLFISDRRGDRDVWIKRADGSRDAQVLLDEVVTIDEAFYSPNGDWIVHRRGMENGQRDIFVIGQDAEDTTMPLAATNFDEVSPALSSDGRWLAYVSNRAGRPDIYVRPFPEADTETLVSVNGGTDPVWSRSRQELYYINGAGDLMAVPVQPGPEFTTGSEYVLFSAVAYRGDFFHPAYDVSVDDERFVMIRLSDSGSLDEELIVVENWFEELNRLVTAQ